MESCAAAKEITFIERAATIQKYLSECHAILDGLMGAEQAETGDKWEEPDCSIEKLHQLFVIDSELVTKLIVRLEKLSRKF